MIQTYTRRWLLDTGKYLQHNMLVVDDPRQSMTNAKAEEEFHLVFGRNNDGTCHGSSCTDITMCMTHNQANAGGVPSGDSPTITRLLNVLLPKSSERDSEAWSHFTSTAMATAHKVMPAVMQLASTIGMADINATVNEAFVDVQDCRLAENLAPLICASRRLAATVDLADEMEVYIAETLIPHVTITQTLQLPVSEFLNALTAAATTPCPELPDITQLQAAGFKPHTIPGVAMACLTRLPYGDDSADRISINRLAEALYSRDFLYVRKAQQQRIEVLDSSSQTMVSTKSMVYLLNVARLPPAAKAACSALLRQLQPAAATMAIDADAIRGDINGGGSNGGKSSGHVSTDSAAKRQPHTDVESIPAADGAGNDAHSGPNGDGSTSRCGTDSASKRPRSETTQSK